MKKDNKINWNQGFDCFDCRYNHPHGHTPEEIRYFKAQQKGISIGYVSTPSPKKGKEV